MRLKRELLDCKGTKKNERSQMGVEFVRTGGCSDPKCQDKKEGEGDAMLKMN